MMQSVSSREKNRNLVLSGAVEFATTRWSIVMSAGHTSSLNSRQAFESLVAVREVLVCHRLASISTTTSHSPTRGSDESLDFGTITLSQLAANVWSDNRPLLTPCRPSPSAAASGNATQRP